MRYVLFVRVGGFDGGDYERVVEAQALPRPGDRFVLDRAEEAPRPEVAMVYHPLWESSGVEADLPVVTVQLYGRADDKPWEPILDGLGFREATKGTTKAVR